MLLVMYDYYHTRIFACVKLRDGCESCKLRQSEDVLSLQGVNGFHVVIQLVMRDR